MAEFQEFKCKICEKVLSNLKFYTDHIKLHQNISNFNFPCPFPTCQRKYTKASSLRAHIARDHGKVVNKLTLEHSRLTSLNCNVRFCEQTCNESSDLIAHLQAHIRKNDTVLCPYGCGKTFSKRSTFSAHLSRKHRYMAQIPERSYSIQSTSAENSAVQEERLAGTTSDELKVQSANIYLSLAQFCLRLITKFHVPYSAVDVIMSQISSIHDLTQENLLCCMKTELGKFETISDYDRTEILKKFSDNNLFTEDLPNIDDVENQCPVLTPFLGVFGGDIYNAEEYVVFLDGKASTHTDNVFSAVAILFSAYYVFNIEYPSEACVTMEFIQRVFAEINPDRGTKCPKNKNIAMKKVLNLSNKLMCFQNIFNLPAYSNV